ncbi:hypothetical protein [Streptomyces sp. NPDC002078]
MRWWGRRSATDGGPADTAAGAQTVVRSSGDGSVAAAGHIGVAVTGDHNRVVLARPVRSAYLEQVRRVVPPQIIGREAELGQLWDFCTAASGPAYAWLRAEAWAGKTALMSWLALNPPPGVRIVPFFITARWGAQNDVTAYTDVMLEQLAELSGEGLPAHLTPATREAHLLRLYTTAARSCAERGERLVLLVDGLDEDRGVTTGADAHSIAGLLPAAPEAGMRVLVAGRLDPPLPGDVPRDHPLRDPAITRILAASPHAQVIRTEAERELKRLRDSGGLEYDLLALVTAAGGGLTAEDLAALTGAVPYEVGDLLRTRAGRTFHRRAGVYLLAHEELQMQAERMLGAAELGRCRARLHTWAEEQHDRGWPADTSGYLLEGYFPMLRAQRDLPRMVRLAIDPQRHDRLFARTGGDATALAEIAAAEQLAIDLGVPDLRDTVRLVISREALEGRNDGLPRQLPRAWAVLGQPARAEALARGMPSLDIRALALADIAGVLVERGDREHALRLLEDAESTADRCPFDIEDERERALVEVGRNWVNVGLPEHAERVLRRIGAPDIREDLLPEIALGWQRLGDPHRAEAVCAREDDELVRATALAALAADRVETGGLEHVWPLVRAAGTEGAQLVLARVAETLLRTGHGPQAVPVFAALDAALGASEVLVDVAEALANAGEYDRALAVAERLDDEEHQGWARQRVVRAMAAKHGMTDRVRRLAESVEHPEARMAALVNVVKALALAQDHERAERLAHSVDDWFYRSRALNVAIEALGRAGRYGRAQELAEESDAQAGSDHHMAAVVEVLAGAGDLSGALHLARRSGGTAVYAALIEGALAAPEHLVTPGEVAETVGMAEADLRSAKGVGTLDAAHFAKILIEAGHAAEARPLVDDLAATVLALVGRPSAEPSAGEAVWGVAAAETLAWDGRFDVAEEMARYLGSNPLAFMARNTLVERLCAASERSRALSMAETADAGWQDHLRLTIVTELAPKDTTAAGKVAAEIGLEYLRARAWSRIALAHAAAGDREGAADALAEACQEQPTGPGLWAVPDLIGAHFAAQDRDGGDRLLDQVRHLPDAPPGFHADVVGALAEAGEFDRATSLIGTLDAEDRLRGERVVLVKALVKAGDVVRARRLADGLAVPRANPSTDDRRMWLALAPALDAGEARVLLARALQHDLLMDALPAVLRLEPRVAPFVVAMLCGGTASTAARTSARSST